MGQASAVCATERLKPSFLSGKNSDFVVVIGAQWGDEGKGKIVKMLTEHAGVCARFNGGANNVHTVYADGEGTSLGRSSPTAKKGDKATEMTFRLLPCSALNQDCDMVLGNGMVIHLDSLMAEIDMVCNFDPRVLKRLFISMRAHLVLDSHIVIDGIFDGMREKALGTTKRGIGPAYSTKSIRNGLRMGDLKNFVEFERKFREIVQFLQKHNDIAVDIDEELRGYKHISELLSRCIVDTVTHMNSCMRRDYKIVCEGANSTLSDLDFGTYPYVTSSNTTVGGVCTGLGVPLSAIKLCMGVCKAYTTRAQHWFPSEVTDEKIVRHLVGRGAEVGTSTKKERRVGWLDLPAIKFSALINGFDSLVLTKVDVLGGLSQLKLGVGYEEPKFLGMFPDSIEDFNRLKCIYADMPVWPAVDLSKIRSYDNLHENCKAYIKRIEEFVEVPISWLTLSNGRNIQIRN